MSILSAQSLRKHSPLLVSPFHEKTIAFGMSYGCSHAGYDIRIAEGIIIGPGCFTKASAIEYFRIPNNIMAFVHDKSTWARRGLSVLNTVLEPGWCGYLTLELANQNRGSVFEEALTIEAGMPIAQVVFQWLDEPTDTPYAGKYMNQAAGPQPAKFE